MLTLAYTDAAGSAEIAATLFVIQGQGRDLNVLGYAHPTANAKLVARFRGDALESPDGEAWSEHTFIAPGGRACLGFSSVARALAGSRAAGYCLRRSGLNADISVCFASGSSAGVHYALARDGQREFEHGLERWPSLSIYTAEWGDDSPPAYPRHPGLRSRLSPLAANTLERGIDKQPGNREDESHA